MKASTLALVVLGVAGAGAGVYFLVKRSSTTAVPAGDTHAIDLSQSKGGMPGLRGIEDQIGAALGLPPQLSATRIGDAANSAPTYLKIGVLPIGATAVAQSIINNPKGAALKVGSAFKSAGSTAKKVGSTAVSAVGGVVSSIGSLF